MKIGFICAIAEESKHILKDMEIHNVVERIKNQFYEGTFMNTDLVLVVSGMGKVSSALCTQILIDQFDVDLILFSGIAGGVNSELEIGDTVIATETLYHDVDRYGDGIDTNTPHSFFRNRFRPSVQLIQLLQEGFEEVSIAMSPVLHSLREKGQLKIVFGRVLTGDQVITSKAKVQYLRDTFAGDCVEMEGAAVAQTCTLNAKPFVIIRTISDLADELAMEIVHKSMESVVHINFEIVKKAVQILTDQRQESSAI